MKDKAIAFISYRSWKDKNNQSQCLVNNGHDCDHRNRYYEKCDNLSCNYRLANLFREYMITEKICDASFLMPPRAILPDGMLLTPYDFLDLMRCIYDKMHECNVFVRFGFREVMDSYWTLLERDIWRRHNPQNPLEYWAEHTGNQKFNITGPYRLEEMSAANIEVWTRVYTYIRDTPGTVGHFWGRYSRNCYVVSCSNCGASIVISAKCINKLCELGMRITCPFCDTASFSFIKNNKEVCEYLKGKPPILQVVPHHTSNQFSSLIDPDIILALLLNDDECCPGNIPLCCLQEESFPKDAQIAMESVLIVPLAIRGIMGGLKALYNVNKGKDNKNVVIRYRDEQGKCYEQTARLELPDDTK